MRSKVRAMTHNMIVAKGVDYEMNKKALKKSYDKFSTKDKKKIDDMALAFEKLAKQEDKNAKEG